ncbi:DNA-binding response regulator [Dyadobacter luteus]|jgi:two-component system LytT family response regulator|uniref:DNA-binding response regulator n=1 Tax=Dyadobacter luteus TaxID=2259619 RepID=A0A3D8YFX2_9BACT|nr:response regulator transcription factor [Dyadobacter luteus]REA63543.1 DNA-binding response regulator [Dyadobacter luteus]
MIKKEISCVIVDDEPLAQNLLCRFVERLDYLKLLGIYPDALKALNAVRSLKPDILLLDISMPEVSGMEMIKMLGASRPYVIFTTAYPNHAAESYDFEATDYLVKPISFERFVRAINKVSEQMELQSKVWGGQLDSSAPAATESVTPMDNFFMVKSNKKLIKVNIDDIVMVEGMKDYLKINLANSMIVIHMTLSKMEQILKSRQFIRVNKSYIVSVKEIKTIDGNEMELSNNQKVTIGATFRDLVLRSLQGRII